MKYTIFDVAKWFLNKSPNMSHKKLQKLCWYAYSWDKYMNYNIEENSAEDSFITNERAEAWVHGPVFPILHNDVVYNSKSKINSANEDLSDEFNAFLTSIYETYGNFTGEELESISHQEMPWKNARNGFSIFEKCNIELAIIDVIKEYQSRYV